MSNSIEISIIIPVYNEEVGLKKTLNRMKAILNNESYETIIVNDGSSDSTSDVLKEFKGIMVIDHENNHGYGASLKTGIKNANNDIICITDADGTYPTEKIPYFLNQLIENDLDMVVGARTGKNVKIPMLRKPAKWVIGKLANWVTGQPIPDINSGLRVFKKSSFMPFQYIVPDGFSFTTTITLGMLSGGYKVKFIPSLKY